MKNKKYIKNIYNTLFILLIFFLRFNSDWNDITIKLMNLIFYTQNKCINILSQYMY